MKGFMKGLRAGDVIAFESQPVVNSQPCRVYWGSHGCRLERGHEGPHSCDCADEPTEEGVHNVGPYPYYGPSTVFYGEDVGDLEKSGRWFEAWGVPA